VVLLWLVLPLTSADMDCSENDTHPPNGQFQFELTHGLSRLSGLVLLTAVQERVTTSSHGIRPRPPFGFQNSPVTTSPEEQSGQRHLSF